MLGAEATLRNDKEIPFSITGTDAGLVISKARTYDDGSGRDAAACELNLSGYQLVAGCAFLLGAAKLLLWALLWLWLFELSGLLGQALTRLGRPYQPFSPSRRESAFIFCMTFPR